MDFTAEKLRRLIVDYSGIAESKITDEADLLDDLGIDSLEKVELVMGAEQEFGVEITDDMAIKIRTFGDLVRAVQEAS